MQRRATRGSSPSTTRRRSAPPTRRRTRCCSASEPACRSHNVFRSQSGEFQCGIWDSTPYQRAPIFFAHSELMHLLEGSVTFTDEEGRIATFHKGDTFIIEQGARCSWASFEHVAKIYAHYKPA